MAKKPTNTKRIVNRRATHDYTIGKNLVVGIVLSGAETKALRLGHGQLQGAYVTVKDGELWLVNAKISGTSGVPIEETSQTRSRKLLAKQKEIGNLISNKQKGLTIIPLEILIDKRYIKLRIASAKGKREYDKRETLKRRDSKKSIDQAMKVRAKTK